MSREPALDAVAPSDAIARTDTVVCTNMTRADTVARIDALLPQTQCTRCGYSGCQPYAAAIASGAAQINQCPPGGAATIAALAQLLERERLPLNPANGVESPPRVAWIDEARCIGCARCLPPCPVDAIVGAARYMHTVLIDRCTGCELCIAPCPVDCIELRPRVAAPIPANRNRARYQAHTERLARRVQERQRALDALKAGAAIGKAAVAATGAEAGPATGTATAARTVAAAGAAIGKAAVAATGAEAGPATSTATAARTVTAAGAATGAPTAAAAGPAAGRATGIPTTAAAGAQTAIKPIAAAGTAPRAPAATRIGPP